MHPIRDQKILFVTGRLAEVGVRETVSRLSAQLGFSFEIAVPGIQVAALLHVNLLLNRLQVPAGIDRVVLPGWIQGDLNALDKKFGVPFERGPKDYRDLPQFFGLGRRKEVDLQPYSIDIIGEINHATQQPLEQILSEATAMARGN